MGDPNTGSEFDYVDPRPEVRWPVAVSRPIAASARMVWEAISSPGNLEPCHPFCAANPVYDWPGETSRDEVHYLNGWVLERRFSSWFEGIGYDLEIGRRGGRQSFVTWRVRPIDSGRSALRIAVYPYVLQELPVVIRWLPYRLKVRPLLTQYLSSVVGGFEWYVTRGEPVPRNHFGPHPWFSGSTHGTGRPAPGRFSGEG